MREFVIGRGLNTLRFSPENLLEPLGNELTPRPPPPTKVTSLSAPVDVQELFGHASSLRSPTLVLPEEGLPPACGPAKISTPPIDVAQQSIPVGPLAPHDPPGQLERDRISVSTLQIPLIPTAAATASPCQDCPKIDLIALVREKQKAERLRKGRPSAPFLPEEPHRRVESRGPRSRKFR
jgi:hypothetical protein